MANDNFIHMKCAICGDTDTGDMALSQLTLKLGFGSKHDGESVSLPLCGKCVDRLHNYICFNQLCNGNQSFTEKSADQDSRDE